MQTIYYEAITYVAGAIEKIGCFHMHVLLNQFCDLDLLSKVIVMWPHYISVTIWMLNIEILLLHSTDYKVRYVVFSSL